MGSGGMTPLIVKFGDWSASGFGHFACGERVRRWWVGARASGETSQEANTIIGLPAGTAS